MKLGDFRQHQPRGRIEGKGEELIVVISLAQSVQHRSGAAHGVVPSLTCRMNRMNRIGSICR